MEYVELKIKTRKKISTLPFSFISEWNLKENIVF